MMRLFLDLDPQPKRRPRFRRKGNKVYTYSDPKDLNFKKAVQLFAKNQIDYPLDGPLVCKINFFIKPPKTIKLKYPVNKRSGDLDNLAKNVLDALNGLAYQDDSQIVRLTCMKAYRDISGIELELYSLN